MAETKTCSKCGETKPLSDYYLSRGTPRSTCKACHKAAKDAWEAANPGRHSDTSKKWRAANRERYRQSQEDWRARNPGYNHGLSPESFDAMLREQGGVCRICGEPETAGRQLAIDHDAAHCPGRFGCPECVRGLLCNQCNRGLGFFGHDPELLRKAADYIERGTT